MSELNRAAQLRKKNESIRAGKYDAIMQEYDKKFKAALASNTQEYSFVVGVKDCPHEAITKAMRSIINDGFKAELTTEKIKYNWTYGDREQEEEIPAIKVMLP